MHINNISRVLLKKLNVDKPKQHKPKSISNLNKRHLISISSQPYKSSIERVCVSQINILKPSILQAFVKKKMKSTSPTELHKGNNNSDVQLIDSGSLRKNFTAHETACVRHKKKI